ncbi:hypothetical protein MGG_17185, partial [Pyricularia oryzae 70-15]
GGNAISFDVQLLYRQVVPSCHLPPLIVGAMELPIILLEHELLEVSPGRGRLLFPPELFAWLAWIATAGGNTAPRS